VTSGPADSLAVATSGIEKVRACGLRPLKRLATSWAARAAALSTFGLALVASGAVFWFGSLSTAVAYLRGDRIIPDAYTKTFGEVPARERPSIDFLLRNWGKEPIKVLGTNSPCSCLISSGVPVVIRPGESAVLSVRALSKGRAGPYSSRLSVITDDRESDVVLTVQGAFR